LGDTDADVYIINHHGVKVMGDELAKRTDIDTVIIDEIAMVCRNKTEIWKGINKIVNAKGCIRRAWGLTGTPIPNEPTDAYHQIKLLCPERMQGMYFRTFRDRCMLQLNQFKWIAKPNAVDIVDEVMQPAIRFTRDDCIDLPPTIYMTRQVELTPEQKKAYKHMLNQLHTELENGEITASNEAVKAGKLVQIACGVVYDNDKVARAVPAKPRMDEVLALLEQSQTKTIVFVPYRAPLQMVADAVRAAGYDVGVIHGGVSKNDRDQVFQSFQSSPNKKHVIVAQPAAMSHGLTLTAASQIVWYAPVTSAETYEQANGRITRPGQKHTPVIVHIEGTEIERRIFSRLRTKQKMQNLLLEKKTFA
jgi:SNF2 family DNA or RNA helicase